MSIEGRIVYFEKPGWRCTDEVLAICKRRADELGIKTAVVPSVTGYVALKAVEVLKGMRLVVVTAHTGYARPNLQSFPEAKRRELAVRGVAVLTAPHVFGGLSYAMRDLYGTALLGVDTCAIEGFAPAEYDAILGLKEQGYASVVCCALGYRSSDDKYASAAKVRFPVADLIKTV